MKKNLLARFFEFLSETIMGAERAILDFLSALVPYAVPIIPAYLTYYHTIQMMNFPVWVAWTTAFVVEVLGLASVATAVRFYQHNRNVELDKEKYKLDKNKARLEKNKAPFWIAALVYLFYIAVVLTVNVKLEIVANQRSMAVITAIGLFSLLSFPSGVLISIRAQFGEMLENNYARHVAAKGILMNPAQPAGTTAMGFSGIADRTKHASDYHDKIIAMLESAHANGKILNPRDITRKLNLPHDNNKGYVSTQRTDWARAKGIDLKRSGKG